MTLSKAVFKDGFMYFRDRRYGLIDFNLNTSNNRVQVLDTVENNELLAGLKTWTFTASIFIREDLNITPSEAAESIVFQYESKAMLGTGFIFEVEEVGSIDSALVYNISGEFVTGSRQLELIQDTGSLVDAWNWNDDNGDGLANGWFEYATPTTTIGTDLVGRGPYQNLLNSVSAGQGVFHDATFVQGTTYRVYIEYEIVQSFDNEVEFHKNMSLSTGISMSDSVGYWTLDSSWVAGASDNRIGVVGDPTAIPPGEFRIFFMLVGTLIRELT